MFFFFFDELFEGDPIIRQAFQKVCLGKMLVDGYFDMSKYVDGKIKPMTYYADLENARSVFAGLFTKTYPKKEKAVEFWNKFLEANPTISGDTELSLREADAVVYWLFRVIEDKNDRIGFIRSVFSYIKTANSVPIDLMVENGIAYNSLKVQIELISSVADFRKLIESYKINQENLFYRGHSDANYLLQPSVFRSRKHKENESKMYNEIMIECPKDFTSCSSHLDKLVEMQHYGIPTRLLDITGNPLVALYFACAGHESSLGELILIDADSFSVKYPQSDAVSILASLAPLPYSQQRAIYDAATDASTSKQAFNLKISKLIHEIKQEKPAFQSEVEKQDLLENFIVLAVKNNQRIVKQDGAFIICGLRDFYYSNYEEDLSLNKFRLRVQNKTLIVLIKNKKKIMKELNSFSINRATLFPEIESVAQHIREKYQ